MIDLEITDGVAFITLNAPGLGGPAAALEVERGAQLWSLRRRASQ